MHRLRGTGELNPALAYALEEPAIRTNVAGWTAAVDWACGVFERQGAGHLVCVTSVGGLRGSGAAPAYSASKAYQINYAEGLRQRFARLRIPVRVTDVRPGLTATAMARGEGLFWVMPVERVVGQILRAIRRRKAVAVVTRQAGGSSHGFCGGFPIGFISTCDRYEWLVCGCGDASGRGFVRPYGFGQPLLRAGPALPGIRRRGLRRMAPGPLRFSTRYDGPRAGGGGISVAGVRGRFRARCRWNSF